MPSPPAPISFDLDISGTSNNNRVIDEPYELVGSSNNNRVLVPRYAPFFPSSHTNALVLIDGDTNTPLVRGQDYYVVEFHQELSLRYGKEIASAIIVTNPAISNEGLISYQTIGWHYVNNSDAIRRLYESLNEDDRPVDWENILNKPIEYPPTNHNHLLYDVYGFEPVVDGLERIKRAITLGQTSLAVSMIEKLMARFNFGELESNIPNKRLVTYDALLAVLTRLNVLSTLSVRFLSGPRIKGRSFCIEIESNDSGFLNRIIYLTVQDNLNNGALIPHVEANPNNPSDPNHIRLNENARAYVYFYVTTDETVKGNNLYLGLRYSNSQSDYDAVTYDVDALDTESVANYYVRRKGVSNYLLVSQMESVPPIYRFRDLASNSRSDLFYRTLS